MAYSMKRCIHIDFHTMPGVTDFAKHIDAEATADRFASAHVTWVNLFARCNIGFSYYPTKIGIPYPGLQRDLLGELIEACHKRDIGVTAYLNIDLDHELFRLHPEYCRVNQDGSILEQRIVDNNFYRSGCLNGAYRSYLMAEIREILTKDPDGIFSFYEEIGCRFAAVPWMAAERRPGTERFAETVESIRAIGAKAKEHGIQLLYHNHDFEFVKVDGEYALDMLYRVVEPEYLATEIDTCWVNVAGENPAAYVRKYTGRAPIVHLKDFFMEDGADKDGMYELIGVAKKANARPSFEFRCVGHGKQFFPGIIAAAEDAGAGWLIVEQDRPSQGLSPMECADISRKYLKSIGY